MSSSDGIPTTEWVVPDGLDSIKCRIDLGFLRPGLDAPPPDEAGKIPDRVGLMLYSANSPILWGDHIQAIDGPIQGIFTINGRPDVAQGFGSAHHMEVQVKEVAQIASENFFNSED